MLASSPKIDPIDYVNFGESERQKSLDLVCSQSTSTIGVLLREACDLADREPEILTLLSHELTQPKEMWNR